MAIVSGADKIIRNLNRELKKIEGDVQKGLTLGMLKVKGDSMRDTPVDTGNLKGSHYLVAGDGTTSQETRFIERDESGRKVAAQHGGHVTEAQGRARSKGHPFVELGCTAFYAEKVHEDLEARHPVGKAKFMEDSLKANQKHVLDTVRRFAQR